MHAEHGLPACACGEPVFIRKTGECSLCYHRRRRAEMRSSGELCSVCGQRPVEILKTRECRACYDRRRPQRTRVSRNPARVPSTTYGTSHDRVRVARGAASSWRCIHCGAPAQEWAYRAGSPREISAIVVRGGKRKHLSWSPDPADYDPMCKPCHGDRDRPGEYGRGYRSDAEKARASRRQWASASYARSVSTPAGREAYRARKRAERRRREQRDNG